MSQSPISHASAISIGLAITCIGAAASFGILWQKVNDMDRRLVRIEEKLDKKLAGENLPAIFAAR